VNWFEKIWKGLSEPLSETQGVKEDALKECRRQALRAPRLLAQTYAMNNLSPRAQQVLAWARKEAIRQHGFHPNPNNVRKRTIPR
jgi:hypothetical protein